MRKSTLIAIIVAIILIVYTIFGIIPDLKMKAEIEKAKNESVSTEVKTDESYKGNESVSEEEAISSSIENKTQSESDLVVKEEGKDIKSEAIPDNEEEKSVTQILDEARTITIKEEFISFNKKYNIYADDKYVGTIAGKFINLTGDVFTFTDKNGNVISSEKQIKRWGIKLNRLAEFRDKNGNTTRFCG